MHEQILAMRGKLSFSLIAEHFGISRNAVAGIMWRANWPPEKRVCSPRSKSPNKCGIGRHGHGEYALIVKR